VNAATLALIDAGIPIRDVCCAVSCGLVTKNGEAQTLVDLAYAEESGRVPTVVATGMPKTGEMVFFEVESRLHLDYLEKITKDVSEGIRHVHRQLEELILRKKD